LCIKEFLMRWIFLCHDCIYALSIYMFFARLMRVFCYEPYIL
jgi:hypothetical protein